MTDSDDSSQNKNNPRDRNGVDRKLLDMLVCPVTRGPLEYDEERGELISKKAGLAFPIRDGIPIMLADEARPLEENEKS